MSVKEIIRHTGNLYKMLSNINYGISINRNKKNLLKNKVDGVKEIVSKSMEELVGYRPNFDEPKTFNDKMQWLKIYWYDPRVVQCCDKDTVRQYVIDKGLEKILIPQIAVFDRVEDIKYEELPDRFVLKPSHDSGHTYICRDKANFDYKKTNKSLKKWLSCDFTFRGMEWGYHTNHPKIVCEELIEDSAVDELYDYKFFCFNGEPKYIFFVSDRENDAKSDFYDLDWELQDFRWYYEPSRIKKPKPKCFDEMIQYAKVLTKDFPFVRVDFYEANGKVYFGELTFFHGSGYGWFKPKEYDRIFGDMLILPQKSSVGPWEQIINDYSQK